MKTVSIVSLGCFRNTYDSETVLTRYLRQGYRISPRVSQVDTLVINTCGFIASAKEESLEHIAKAIQLKKRKKVRVLVVIGCLVERYRKQLEKYFPEVDQWQGVVSFPFCVQDRAHILPSHLAFLKICEGCWNNCSYCVIPRIKGGLVSRSRASILEEVRRLEANGVKEVTIIGQDVTSWGKDRPGEGDLVSLLKEIVKTTKNIPWFRILYTHPRAVTRKLVDFIAHEERICKYVDLPLQHINDRILRLMNRHVTRKEIVSLIGLIRRKIPGVVIRTSCISGFPSETEREHKELCRFIAEMGFERLGVFEYSREEGTKAFRLKEQLHHATKRRRRQELMTLQQHISNRLNKNFIGRKLEVLVDGKTKDFYVGRSQFHTYQIDGIIGIQRRHCVPGHFYTVTVQDAGAYDLVAS